MAPIEGVNYRYDCPECGGKNSFSITREHGVIKYNCFKLRCKNRNVESYLRSIEELKGELKIKEKHFELPDYIEFGPRNEQMIQELQSKNSWEAFTKGYIDIGYDPKEDRLLFFIKTLGKITGCVGRALAKSFPKVKIYPNSTGVLTIGFGPVAILVEDIFSACSVSRNPKYTGIPLNGTTLKVEHLNVLKTFDKVILALDKDASRKAVKYLGMLKFIKDDVSVYLLEEDLKDSKILPDMEANMKHN